MGFDPSSQNVLTLGFAEMYTPNCGNGKRKIVVAVNGAPFITDLDVYQEAGGCKAAYLETGTVTANRQGEYVIAFTASVQNPMVSTIAIDPVSGPSPPAASTTSPDPNTGSTANPTIGPTRSPTTGATSSTIIASPSASAIPSDMPSLVPSDVPSDLPSFIPSDIPTKIEADNIFLRDDPSNSPTSVSSSQPSIRATSSPMLQLFTGIWTTVWLAMSGY